LAWASLSRRDDDVVDARDRIAGRASSAESNSWTSPTSLIAASAAGTGLCALVVLSRE
jgi:hypothetical protein